MEQTAGVKVYEACANVHIPSLKCSYMTGTRFTVRDDVVSVGCQETPFNIDFVLLVRNGLLRELSDDESRSPENVRQPRVIRVPERKKMRVEIQDEQVTQISQKEIRKEPQQRETGAENDGGVRMVRGMKVVTTESTPIRTGADGDSPERGSSAPEITPEKQRRLEEIRQARLAGLVKARQAAMEKAAQRRAEKEAEAGREAKNDEAPRN